MARKTITKRAEIAGRKLLIKIYGLFQPKQVFSSIPSCYKPRRILFLRHDRIGDMAVTIPFFRAIKRKLPDADIGILVSLRNKILLRYEPDYHLITYRKRPDLFFRSLWEVFRWHPDVVVDLQLKESVTSTTFAIASRAKWRVRIKRDVKLPFNVYVDVGEFWHIQDEMRALFSAIAPIDIDEVPKSIMLSERERKFAEDFFSKVSAPKEKLIGLNISAGFAVRMLSAEDNKRIASHILRRGFVPVILYEPRDAKIAREICDAVRGAYLGPLCPDILHAAAIIEKLNLIVTPDTSVVHIASGFGVPTLALYTANEWNRRRWLPWGVKYRWVASTDYDSLAGINIDDILTKFDELIIELNL
ncbi:glycosyltransferase family 9 protein [bacterium]|nr:glycosyltransferase family 9 protein [bacterium]